jgi:hypothetical protein
MSSDIEPPSIINARWSYSTTSQVQVTDPTDHKTIREIANATIPQRVVRRTENVGVVNRKRFSSGDLVIQLKEQAGKEILAWRSAWLE